MGKYAIVVAAGVLVVFVMYIFVSLVKMAFFERSMIIAPFEIVNPDKSPQLGAHLAVMLQTRLSRMRSEFTAAQESLMSTSLADIDESFRHHDTAAPQPPPKVSDLTTAVLTILDIKVSVGGVEVGKILPWISNMLVDERTLRLSISYETNRAIVTGSLKPLTNKEDDVLEVSGSVDSSELAELLAGSIFKRKLSKDGDVRFETLTDQEFLALVKALIQIDQINRRSHAGRSSSEEYAELLPALEGFAKKLPSAQVNYLIANVAEAAGSHADKAISYYLLALLYSVGKDKDEAALKSRITKRLSALDSGSTEKIKLIEAVKYATGQCNVLFDVELPVPGVVFEPDDLQNAYWDNYTKSYHVAQGLIQFPDLAYVEIAHRYVVHGGGLQYSGIEGSIASSYSDVIAAFLKQQQDGKTADNADWMLGAGALRVLIGSDVANPDAPVRSLIAPGTAFARDVQIAKFDNPSPSTEQTDDVHVRSGLANKAFVSVAKALHDTRRALDIWLKVLPDLRTMSDKTFSKFARLTFEAAGSPIEKAAVRQAWSEVGVLFP